jgi:hypothetical protein
MSAPHWARVIKDEEEIAKVFVNVGWIWDEGNLLRQFKELRDTNQLPSDYDYISAYDTIYFREEINLL